MMMNFILGLVAIAALWLLWGGVTMIRRNQDRQKGGLMIIAALVFIANVLIIVWP